jgi:hypothetical protein
VTNILSGTTSLLPLPFGAGANVISVAPREERPSALLDMLRQTLLDSSEGSLPESQLFAALKARFPCVRTHPWHLSHYSAVLQCLQ